MSTYEQIRNRAVAVVLDDHGVLRVTGKDAQEYLHRMVTQEIRNLGEGECRHACLCTHKGRLIGTLHVARLEGALHLVVPLAHLEGVQSQLERYIIMDDVEVADVTNSWALFSVQGPNSPGLCKALFQTDDSSSLSDSIGIIGTIEESPALAFEFSRTGERGFDLMVSASTGNRVREKLERDFGIPVLTREDPGLERCRIEAILGKPGVEWTDEIIPVEAGLGHTISYTKGCYAGQEVIAKIKYLGEPPKTLVALTIDASPEGLQPGTPLFSGENPVGELSSVFHVNEEGGQSVALAWIKTRRLEGLKHVNSRPGEGAEFAGTVHTTPVRTGSAIPCSDS